MRIETGFKVKLLLVFHHFSETIILWSKRLRFQQRLRRALCGNNSARAGSSHSNSPEITISNKKHKQQHYGSRDKRESTAAWPFLLLNRQEALKAARFCRLRSLQLVHLYIRPHDSLEKMLWQDNIRLTCSLEVGLVLFLRALSESWKTKDFSVKIKAWRENLQSMKSRRKTISAAHEVSSELEMK